ncbi:hypothetical protein C8J57DRAFT_1507764 [Mycena rebaudengoi]|nr:hypothetical protein C8J57DRAFT_1507764 [Mycena rebaudengoi]
MTVFLVTSALAQSIVVDAPRPGANILLTYPPVDIRPRSNVGYPSLPQRKSPLQSDLKSADVVEGCEPGAQLLYNGPYTPTLHTPTIPGQPSFDQNFTFPSPFFTPGPVELTVVHFIRYWGWQGYSLR